MKIFSFNVERKFVGRDDVGIEVESFWQANNGLQIEQEVRTLQVCGEFESDNIVVGVLYGSTLSQDDSKCGHHKLFADENSVDKKSKKSLFECGSFV